VSIPFACKILKLAINTYIAPPNYRHTCVSTVTIFRFPATSMKLPWLASTLDDPAKKPEGAWFVVGETCRGRFTNKDDESDEVDGS
jgi:hypothetical protein